MRENKARTELVDLFTNCLNRGDIPWYQGFTPLQTSFNPITKTVYKNSNRFILYINEYVNKYEDPRWMTFKQAKEKGYSIKKGSKGVHVEYWSLYDTKEKKSISQSDARQIMIINPERGDDFRYISQVYTVFNAKQIDGISPYVAPTSKNKFDEEKFTIPLEVMKSFSKNANLVIEESKSADTPFYRPIDDKVVVPNRTRYISEDAFFSDTFHEIAHSTSHKSRLNRELLPYSVSQEDYAIEELRAEIGSAFVCNSIGIKPQSNRDYLDNSVAYVQSWIKSINEKPNALFAAVKDAEKISDYILDKGRLEKKLEIQEMISDYIDNGNYKSNSLTIEDLREAIEFTDILELPESELSSRIEGWVENHDDLEKNLFYAIEGDTIVCADNRDGECFVEEFKKEDALMALMWMEDVISYEDYLSLSQSNNSEVCLSEI